MHPIALPSQRSLPVTFSYEATGLSARYCRKNSRRCGQSRKPQSKKPRAKARGYARAAGLWALADDSGLEVDALGGRPGVRSARYAGPGAGDEANLALLLREMAGVPAGRRGARFRCWAVLAAPEGIVAEAEGVCAGRIAAAPAGGGGFGYDPVFVVDGAGRTMAELADAEKDEVSHRGRALRALRPELERRWGPAGGRA